LWARLKQISTMQLKREELLMKLGAARSHAPKAWRLIEIEVAESEASYRRAYGLTFMMTFMIHG
jgi:hypothetical protein